MTTNWLELMGDDSALSLTSADEGLSRQADPELDHSRQGVNLMFKKSIKIISEDSLSRKRTLKEMKSTDTDGTLRAMSKLPPPKAKQRMDDEGHWAHRKGGAANENAGGPIGFQRFLKWAPNAPTAGNRAILGSRTNNNRANIMRSAASSASAAPLTALVTCTPGQTRSRKLSRGRRSRKTTPRKTPTPKHTPTPAPATARAECKHSEDVTDHKEDSGDIATSSTTPTVAATASKNATMAEKEVTHEKKTEEEDEDDEEEDVDMAEVEPSGDLGPHGTRLENAVCAEEVIDLDGNDNDADDEDDEDDEKVLNEDAEDEKQTAKDEKDESKDDDDDDEEDEEDGEEDDDEDVDLTPADRRASLGRRSRRVTPTLSNVVFDTDLILKHKVPILRKKTDKQEPAKALTGPVFLNGDQYDKLHPREERRDSQQQLKHQPQQQQQQQQQQLQQSQGQGAGAGNPKPAKQLQAPVPAQQQPKQVQCVKEPGQISGPAPKQRMGSVKASPEPKRRQRQGPLSWASKLFGRGLSASRSEQQMAMEERNARRIMLSRESSVRSSDIKSVQSVQSEQTADSVHSGESQQSKGSHAGMAMGMSLGMGVSIGRVSSFSRVGSPKSVGSRASSVSVVCAPSEGAVKWREKQIQYGTNTEGYKNFIAQYPNKDAMFRLNHEFVPTPDPKEKIGKKRWVGKYQKWRKFLHKFDTVTAPNTEGSESCTPNKLHDTATETQTETTETEVEDDREQSI